MHTRHLWHITLVALFLCGWFGNTTAALTVYPSGGDDTARLKCLLENECTDNLERRCQRLSGRPAFQGSAATQCGAIRFGPGEFQISKPILLKGGRSYLGEGSFAAPYGSVIHQRKPRTPIFVVDGAVADVVIAGLTFTGQDAKAIVASNPQNSFLADSIIRENHFLSDLSECIAVPLVGTVVTANMFGKHGPEEPVTLQTQHRHIYSAGLNPSWNPSNHNWIVNNLFQNAMCTTCALEHGVSVGFERGVSLHLIGNRWEGNRAQRTVALLGMFNVEMKGNYFENNTGAALVRFANDTVGAPGDRQGNYIVRTENNYYNVAGASPPQFLFDHDFQASTIYMGFEAGTGFQTTEILHPDAFALDCYLRLTGPIHFVGYQGGQLGSRPPHLDCPAPSLPYESGSATWPVGGYFSNGYPTGPDA